MTCAHMYPKEDEDLIPRLLNYGCVAQNAIALASTSLHVWQNLSSHLECIRLGRLAMHKEFWAIYHQGEHQGCKVDN